MPDHTIEIIGGDSDQGLPPTSPDNPLDKYKIPLTVIIAALLICGCCIVALIVIFGKLIDIDRLWSSTITPTASSTPTLTSTINYLQLYTITPQPTFTFTPTPSSTLTPIPTLTPTKTPFMTATDTVRPTHRFTATFRPASSKTPTLIKAVCACSNDYYDCKDFDTHAEAQACYDFCVYQGWGDVHNLDVGGSGVVCRGLP